jgi:hypothetical protein
VFPSDFARGKPRRFQLPADWPALRERYSGLGPSRPLDWVYEHLASLAVTDVLLEHEYLDRDYRDEYREFYAQTFRWVPDRCERLHFWNEEGYVGYCSLRPIKGRPVGRTMLDPGLAFQDDVACVVKASASPYGLKLSAPAFPFISQDRQYGRCAQAVIWMIAHYHHLRHGAPQRLMSEIVRAAAATETERVLPSKGLTDEQVGDTFRRLDLSALRFYVDTLSQDELEELIRPYLNSAMPIAVGTPGHLTAIIGGGYDASGRLTVVQCDDESGAYVRSYVDVRGANKWEILFVPLPGRIFLAIEDIASTARGTMKQLADDYGAADVLSARTIRYREYVVEVSEYKRRLFERGLPGRAAEAHAQVASARWIWVLEIQDASLASETPHCVLGELALDATSDEADLIYLFANLPGLRAVWPRGQTTPDVDLEPPETFSPYETGTALNV